MPSTGGDAPNVADEINKLLSSASSGPAAGDAGSDELIFGMTLGALLLASLFGLIGCAYLVYAKKQMKLIVGLCGVGLVLFPLVVISVWGIAAIGIALCALPFVLNRFGIDL